MDPHSRAPKKNMSHGNEVHHISYKDLVTNKEVCAKIQQAVGLHEDRDEARIIFLNKTNSCHFFSGVKLVLLILFFYIRVDLVYICRFYSPTKPDLLTTDKILNSLHFLHQLVTPINNTSLLAKLLP